MAICLSASSASYSEAPQRVGTLTRFTYTEYHMGVDARLVVYAPDQTTAEKACSAAFKRIAELDWTMSDYRKDSELSKLCDKAGTGPVKVSRDLFKVLQTAETVSRRSAGSFDVTVGPLVQLWRKARKTAALPDPVELEKARTLVGYKKVKLLRGSRSVKLDIPGMRLDLGGIGKGYADDEAQKVLKKFGITRALVEMGGDIVVSGPPPETDGWTIRVPNAGDDHGPMDMKFSDCAISTSGDTEQFVVIGGVRYSHVVDPRTGQALTDRTQSTVIAPNGLTSDPLSKVMTFLDEAGRTRFLKDYPLTKAYVKTIRGANTPPMTSTAINTRGR